MSGLGPQIHASQPVIRQGIWEMVSRSPLHSLWNLQGVSSRVVAQHTWNSLLFDNLFGRAAELGFYFLFALFPTLFCASSILGIAAHSAADIYGRLLHYTRCRPRWLFCRSGSACPSLYSGWWSESHDRAGEAGGDQKVSKRMSG